MKRIFVLLLALSCLIFGASVLAEEKERETVILGTKGQLVVRIQQRLMDLGFYHYKPTGSFQAVTRRAALAYEGAAGARQDGRLTPEEQDELFSGGATRAPYSTSIALSFTAQNSFFAVTGELWDWAEVKKELSGMAVDIAEQMVSRELNAADQDKLVDEFIRNAGDKA